MCGPTSDRHINGSSPKTAQGKRATAETSSDTPSSSTFRTRDDPNWPAKTTCYALVQSVLLSWGLVTAGLVNGVLGPFLPHLSRSSGVRVEVVGWLLSSRGAGLVVGTILAGLVLRFFVNTPDPTISDDDDDETPPPSKSESPSCVCCLRWFVKLSLNRILALALWVCAIGLALVPLVRMSFPGLVVVHVAQGIGDGVLEVACNLGMAWVWRHKARPWLQFLHFTYAVGSIVFPLIIAQLLKLVEREDMQLFVAYFGVAVLVFLPGIILYLLPPITHSQNEKKKSANGGTDVESSGDAQQEETPKCQKCVHGVLSFPFFVYFMTAVLKSAVTGSYIAFGAFLLSYGRHRRLGDDVFLTYLTTTYWSTFGVGRLASIVLSLAVRPFLILLMAIVMSVVGISMIALNASNVLALWIGACIHGLFVAPVSASAVALPQSGFGIPLNPISTSMVTLGSSVGQMGVPALLSAIANVAGLGSVMYVILGMYAFSFGVLILEFVVSWLWISCSRKGKRKSECGDQNDVGQSDDFFDVEVVREIDGPSIELVEVD